MTNEKMREEFERWVRFHFDDENENEYKNLLIKANNGNNYRNEIIDIAWIAWEESRDRVEVELPIKFDLAMAGDKSTSRSFFLANKTIETIKHKLNEQGIRVKIEDE